jgi:hypothetical protein
MVKFTNLWFSFYFILRPWSLFSGSLTFLFSPKFAPSRAFLLTRFISDSDFGSFLGFLLCYALATGSARATSRMEGLAKQLLNAFW